MPNPLNRAAFAFAVFIIGVATVAYTARIAYENADTSVEPISVLHPVVETGISTLPIIALIFGGFVAIAGAGWLVVKASSGGRAGGGFR